MKVLLPALLIICSTLYGKLPNVVILYADDMGVADVSYGDPEAKIQTPHLDRLASQGMTFTDGHSSSGICTPSRFALLTGQHHWRRFHGIVGAFGGTVFKPDDFTIAKMFRKKGYRTGCFGKWHLGWNFDAIRKPGAKKKGVHPVAIIGYGMHEMEEHAGIPAHRPRYIAEDNDRRWAGAPFTVF